MEDEKYKAVEMVLNRQILGEEEFDRLMDYIENPNKNQQRDNFSYKFGLVACNEIYASKTGLKDLE